jgi:hypothetical protein
MSRQREHMARQHKQMARQHGKFPDSMQNSLTA